VLAAAPAQKLPLPGDPERCLQLIDLGPLAPGVPGNAPAEPPAADSGQPSPAGLAPLVRSLGQPPPQAGDAAQVLGGRWLAVLASPQQGAAAERLVREALRRRDELITATVTLAEVDAALFDRLLAPLLPAAPAPGGTRQAVLDSAATAALSG